MVRILQTQRKAIAMIELIFALVIMAIALMSAPMLVNRAAQSGYVSLQQEAITAAAAELGMILTYHWDEGDTDNTYSIPILEVNTTTGDSELSEALFDDLNGTGRRSGTPMTIETGRSFLSSAGARASATILTNLGMDPTEVTEDDIDDFIGSGNLLVDLDTTTTNEGDYTDKNMTKTITVTYINDAAAYNTTPMNFDFNIASAVNTTNIKMVTVLLASASGVEELDKNITLRAFSCNIGGQSLEENETMPDPIIDPKKQIRIFYDRAYLCHRDTWYRLLYRSRDYRQSLRELHQPKSIVSQYDESRASSYTNSQQTHPRCSRDNCRYCFEYG